MTQHMHGVLLTIEVFWVAGVLAIFVFYFAVKRRVRAKRRQEAAEASRHERENAQRAQASDPDDGPK